MGRVVGGHEFHHRFIIFLCISLKSGAPLRYEQIGEELCIISKRIPGEGFVLAKPTPRELQLGLAPLKILRISFGMPGVPDEVIHLKAVLSHRLAVDQEPVLLRHQGCQLILVISNVFADLLNVTSQDVEGSNLVSTEARMGAIICEIFSPGISR